MKVRPHRHHPGYWAFLGHRLSGLALAAFLPFHFLALATALDQSRLDALLVWTENPLARSAEWGLVAALVLHFCFGLRLLVVEFGPWTDHDPARGRWIVPSLIMSALAGTAFLIGSLS